MALCALSGVLRDRQNNAVPNAEISIAFESGVVGGADLYSPVVVTTTTDGSGNISVSLLTGRYICTLEANGRIERFYLSVPDVATGDINDFVDQETPVSNTILLQAIAARDAAAASAAQAALFDGPCFDTIDDFEDDGFLTYTAGQDGTVAAGTMIRIGGGLFDVAASGASDQHYTTLGGVKVYEAGPNFSTHARMVAAKARMDAAGTTVPVGTIWTAAGQEYIWQDDANTTIAGMTGWRYRANEAMEAAGSATAHTPALHLGVVPVLSTASDAGAANAAAINQALLDAASMGVPMRTSGKSVPITAKIEIPDTGNVSWISDHSFKLLVGYNDTNGVVAPASGLGQNVPNVVLDHLRFEALIDPGDSEPYDTQMLAGVFTNGRIIAPRNDLNNEARFFMGALYETDIWDPWSYSEDGVGSSFAAGIRIAGGRNSTIWGGNITCRDSCFQMVQMPSDDHPLSGLNIENCAYIGGTGRSYEGYVITVVQKNNQGDGTNEGVFGLNKGNRFQDIRGIGNGRQIMISAQFNNHWIEDLIVSGTFDCSDKDLDVPHTDENIQIGGSVRGLNADIVLTNPRGQLIHIGDDDVIGYTTNTATDINVRLLSQEPPEVDGFHAARLIGGNRVNFRPNIKWDNATMDMPAVIECDGGTDITVSDGHILDVPSGKEAVRFNDVTRGKLSGMNLTGSGTAWRFSGGAEDTGTVENVRTGGMSPAGNDPKNISNVDYD